MHAYKVYQDIENTNLIIVVFPTPGGPMSNKEAPSCTKSRSKIALPDIARPTRQVKPIIAPFRFLMALMRCNVLLMPARLSIIKSPTWDVYKNKTKKNKQILTSTI